MGARHLCFHLVSFLPQVTSGARIEMYKHMIALEAAGAKIFKIACDALYYSGGAANGGIFIKESFGNFKNIYNGDLLSICQLGPNSYATLSTSPSGEIESNAKASGFTISHLLTPDVHYQAYSEALDELLKANIPLTAAVLAKGKTGGNYLHCVSKQSLKGKAAAASAKLSSGKSSKVKKFYKIRKTHDPKTLNIRYVRAKRSIFVNNIISRRAIIFQSGRFITKPYGYTLN